MESISLPSHVHYELLLQLLERKTMPMMSPGTEEYRQVQELIALLRKAYSVQKHLEANAERQHRSVDYLWSLNQPHPETTAPLNPTTTPMSMQP